MEPETARRLEAAWRSLKSVKHDINNGFYEWALIKSYKASEAALCALLNVDLDAYHIHKLSELYQLTSEVCIDEDGGIGKCIEYLENLYTKCFTDTGENTRCDLESTISSFRCSRTILSWAQKCARDR